jgi:hypothetical protein
MRHFIAGIVTTIIGAGVIRVPGRTVEFYTLRPVCRGRTFGEKTLRSAVFSDDFGNRARLKRRRTKLHISSACTERAKPLENQTVCGWRPYLSVYFLHQSAWYPNLNHLQGRQPRRDGSNTVCTRRPQARMSSRLRLDLARLEIFGADDHGGAGARRGAAPADLGHGAFVPLTLPPRSSASLSRLLLDPIAALGDRDDPN